MINKELLETIQNMMGNANKIVSIMEQQEGIIHEKLKEIKDPNQRKEILEKLKQAKEANVGSLQNFQESIQEMMKKK